MGEALTRPAEPVPRIRRPGVPDQDRPDGERRTDFWTKLSARSHSNLYFALIFLDRRRRDAFRDVYRFVRAADDVADRPGDAAARITELAAWRHQLQVIYAEPAGNAPRATLHPYAIRLQRVVRRYQLPRHHFETLLDGLERDVTQRRVPSWAALHDYCEAVAASLAQLCLQILGVGGEAEARYARDVGIALQLANILRDIEEDSWRDHIYLPQDELRAAGVSEDDVLCGRMSPGLSRVCAQLAERAARLIADARRDLSPTSRRRLLVPEIWADVYLDLLASLERADFDVFTRPPYQHRRRKLALAVRRWAADRAPSWLAQRLPEPPHLRRGSAG